VIGDVRGEGLICAIELVSDRKTKQPSGIGAKVRGAAIEQGLYTRAIGDIIAFAPPLIINAEEVDQMVEMTGQAIAAVQSKQA
jgi:adenosylmethionine-8-amino-7-oxononanoate aminotransferase